MSAKRIKAAYMAETGYNSATWLLPADAESYERLDPLLNQMLALLGVTPAQRDAAYTEET